MIITAITAATLGQTNIKSIADQNWTFKLSTVGKFGTPLGVIEDPLINGEIAVMKSKETAGKRDIYRLKFSLKREQTPLISALTGGFPDQKDQDDIASAVYKDKERAYFVESYIFSPTDFKISAIHANEYSPSREVLNPISIAFAIAQRSMNAPELRKEYFVSEDGPRKFFVTFKPNLNANTEQVPGDVAFKFDLKLKDEDQEYPAFFTGAIRLNTKTRLVQYITASSDPAHQPKGPEDADLGDQKSYAIRIDAQKEK